MRTIAIVNEKGGTGKTTTAVNLAAALGRMGRRVLLVDLDGQAASSRWLGVEDDSRLADAMLAGGGLEPLADVAPGVDLAPASGKLDSVAHELRPTQGGQLRRVLGEMQGRYDYVLIDCPPSLGNRLIGNALLAASEALVPVEPSVLALDGLRILLTTLQDVRDGFDHEIKLTGVMACRYETRTRLSRLVLAELNRALPGKVCATVIRETVRMQECPASGTSILDYAPNSHAAEDYLTLAGELDAGGPAAFFTCQAAQGDLVVEANLTSEEQLAVMDFRKHAAEVFCRTKTASPAAAEQPPAEQPPVETVEAEQAEAQPRRQEVEARAEKEEIEITHDSQPPAPQSDDVADEQLPWEDYFSQMPEVYEPDEAPADAPVDNVQRSPRTPDEPQPLPAESGDGRAGYDDEPVRHYDNKVKVAGAAGACMLIGLAVVGWYTFRPSATTSRASASYGLQQTAAARPDAPEITDAQGPVQPDEADPFVADAGTATQPKEDIAYAPQPEPKPQYQQARAAAAAPPRPARPDDEPAENDNKPSPSDFTVTCVLLGSGGGRAIINGQSVREGESVGAAKVVKIMPQLVQIELDGRIATLGIEQPRRRQQPEHQPATGEQDEATKQ